jgi:hypothetical protein
MSDALGVFMSAFAVSAFAGLAALLRSGSKLGWIPVCNALLNSGFLGLGISLLWYTQFKDDLYFLVGVCVLAGLGGMTTVDLVLQWFRSRLTNEQDRK